MYVSPCRLRPYLICIIYPSLIHKRWRTGQRKGIHLITGDNYVIGLFTFSRFVLVDVCVGGAAGEALITWVVHNYDWGYNYLLLSKSGALV